VNERKQQELLELLSELRRHYPDWRLGQLIANVADWTGKNVWDAEDDQLLTAAEEHLRAVAEREARAGM
jgi:hypothetical protein